MRIIEIKPQTGTAFKIAKGSFLEIIDPKGMQVSDVVLFNAHDLKEKFSAGKTMDFEEQILMTTGNRLWSNRSSIMAEIIEDTNGRNDLLLAPCSKETFEIMYNNNDEHPSCLNNLSQALHPFGISVDDVPTAFNIFMNVQFDLDGKLYVDPPTSTAGDKLVLKLHMDCVVGITACSAEDSNGGSFKPIHYCIKN